MIIEIKLEYCMMCGKKFTSTDKIIKGHMIPKCLKPKHNILVLLHNECEQEINKIYVSQQKKFPVKKVKGIIEDAIVKLSSKLDKLGEFE